MIYEDNACSGHCREGWMPEATFLFYPRVVLRVAGEHEREPLHGNHRTPSPRHILRCLGVEGLPAQRGRRNG